jgi:N-acetyltransferase
VAFRFDVPVLHGTLVRLEPLAIEHAGDLARSAEEDRSSYQFTEVPFAAEVDSYLRRRLGAGEAGELAPFAVIRLGDSRAVGCTAYGHPRCWPDRDEMWAVEIGWTWLAASAQRTGVNTDAKLLLLTHAFETLGLARVDLKTDARNERSRRAIEALGARFEGILRQWSPSWAPNEKGMLRDSAMFSVIAAEWPDVKALLHRRLTTAGAHNDYKHPQ